MAQDTKLDSLLKPRAVAVIGATQKPGKVGRLIFEILLRSDRPIYPVHPKENFILGRKVVRSIDELPKDVDVAVIATGAEIAVEAAEACAKKGIPFIIPVAGGFSEVGEAGKALEERLRQIPKNYASRILGPNTLGLAVPVERLDTNFVEHADRALALGGGVALITQSGSVGSEALSVASNIGFGLRAFVGLGNKVDLDEVEFMRHFGDDERTTCVAVYLETMAKAREFLAVARDVAKRKPVVVLKAGRTPSGAKAASSHTGKLAGSDMVVGGALRQYGLLRVFDEEQLTDAARLLAITPQTLGPRVAIVSPGGGYGVMSTDYIESPDKFAELKMAQLSKATKEKLRAVTPGYASVQNPIDLTASATDDMTAEAMRLVLADEGVDMVLCIALFAPAGITDGMVNKICALRWETHKPIVVVAQYGPFTDGILRKFFDGGVVGFPNTARAVRALRFLSARKKLLDKIGGVA